jgi:hypothetical protein
MEPDQFSEFRHKAVHELIRLNDSCEEEFHISSWPRWDYDIERGTLTFSESGVPKIVASIQVVGATSVLDGTWLWGWANERLPPIVTKEVTKLREFGSARNIPQLTKAELPDDEYLGWEMTAIAARLLGAKGAYRCPHDNGFLYVIYSSIASADNDAATASKPKQVECGEHGSGFSTYVCEHLVSNPAQEWCSREPNEEHQWPDAWCLACDTFFQEQGEWNGKNESKIKIKLLCHRCYERLRSQGRVTEAEN